MLVPLLLFALSVAGVVLSRQIPGYSELLLIAGPAALASFYLLLKALVARIVSRRKGMLVLDGVEGGYTKGPDGKQTSIYDAAMAYQDQGIPLVIFGGEQYGAGSSRDWAAKGTALLGVKAVIAESFERIHRSNLVGMGVIPFEFTGGDTRKTLGLKGDETVAIHGLVGVKPLQEVPCTITRANGETVEITLKCRIDTAVEIEYIENGGVLQYVLRNLAKSAA